MEALVEMTPAQETPAQTLTPEQILAQAEKKEERAEAAAAAAANLIEELEYSQRMTLAELIGQAQTLVTTLTEAAMGLEILTEAVTHEIQKAKTVTEEAAAIVEEVTEDPSPEQQTQEQTEEQQEKTGSKPRGFMKNLLF